MKSLLQLAVVSFLLGLSLTLAVKMRERVFTHKRRAEVYARKAKILLVCK